VAGDLELDLATREVRAGGQLIELQPKEFTLLAFLLRHVGRPVTKTMILEHVWDYSFDPRQTWWTSWCTGCAQRWIRNHRRIETVRGVGYVLTA